MRRRARNPWAMVRESSHQLAAGVGARIARLERKSCPPTRCSEASILAPDARAGASVAHPPQTCESARASLARTYGGHAAGVCVSRWGGRVGTVGGTPDSGTAGARVGGPQRSRRSWLACIDGCESLTRVAEDRFDGCRARPGSARSTRPSAARSPCSTSIRSRATACAWRPRAARRASPRARLPMTLSERSTKGRCSDTVFAPRSAVSWPRSVRGSSTGPCVKWRTVFSAAFGGAGWRPRDGRRRPTPNTPVRGGCWARTTAAAEATRGGARFGVIGAGVLLIVLIVAIFSYAT